VADEIEEGVEDADLIGLGDHCFWWEKTVEFLFARTKLSGATIAPLSGAMERYAGDVFLKSAEQFGIVEFKASASTANSEIKKFNKMDPPITDFWEYLPLIQTEYDNKGIVGKEPHLIIYGIEGPEGIALKRGDYWWRWQDDDLFSQATPFQLLPPIDFTDYLRALTKFKMPPKRSKFRGGSVFGVSDGRIVSQIPLDFLVHSLFYRPRPKIENTFTPGGGGGMGRSRR
jgi:hypothetical protein